MDFSIHLDFFLKRISDKVDKKLIEDHHKLIIKHIECAKNYIEIKKQLLTLYQKYNNDKFNGDVNSFDKLYFDIINYIHELEINIDNIQYDGVNQKQFFKQNIFYISKF